MIVSPTGASTTCLDVFLGAFLAAIFDGRFFFAMGFAAPLTLDFACFGFVRFAAFLRAGSALALPRLELFFRVATRFFVLAMAVSCELCRPASQVLDFDRAHFYILPAVTGDEMI
jgi:hypothetical protein